MQFAACLLSCCLSVYLLSSDRRARSLYSFSPRSHLSASQFPGFPFPFPCHSLARVLTLTPRLAPPSSLPTVPPPSLSLSPAQLHISSSIAHRPPSSPPAFPSLRLSDSGVFVCLWWSPLTLHQIVPNINSVFIFRFYFRFHFSS